MTRPFGMRPVRMFRLTLECGHFELSTIYTEEPFLGTIVTCVVCPRFRGRGMKAHRMVVDVQEVDPARFRKDEHVMIMVRQDYLEESTASPGGDDADGGSRSAG